MLGTIVGARPKWLHRINSANLLGSVVDVETNGAKEVQPKDHVVVERQVTNKTAERVIHALGATDFREHDS